jgi:hypothetical protein
MDEAQKRLHVDLLPEEIFSRAGAFAAPGTAVSARRSIS